MRDAGHTHYKHAHGHVYTSAPFAMRAQRTHASLALPLLKMPRHLRQCHVFEPATLNQSRSTDCCRCRGASASDPEVTWIPLESRPSSRCLGATILRAAGRRHVDLLAHMHAVPDVGLSPSSGAACLHPAALPLQGHAATVNDAPFSRSLWALAPPAATGRLRTTWRLRCSPLWGRPPRHRRRKP